MAGEPERLPRRNDANIFAEKAEAARLAYTSRDGEVARLEAQVAERDAEIARLREAAEIGLGAVQAMIEEVEKAQPGAFGIDSMGDAEVPGGLMSWDRGEEILHYLRRDEERIHAALTPPQQAGSETGERS